MSNVDSNWLFRITDPSGNVLVNLIHAEKKSVNIGLNKAGEASFTYDFKELFDLATNVGLTIKSLVGVGRNNLECLRNGVVYFSGQILYLNLAVNDIHSEIEIKALGWFWLLGTRFAGLTTDRVFTNVDAGTIAWTLIDETQALTNGSFGFVQGSIEPSVNRSITYTRKSIKEAIEELADADFGFDFDIDSNKVFTIYYPIKGSDVSDQVIFQYPNTSIKSISEVNDATLLANEILAVGKGWGSEEVSAEDSNVDSQLVFGRREKLLSVKDIDNGLVLADIAAQANDIFSNVNPKYSIKYTTSNNTPDLQDFDTGDFILLRVKEDYWDIEQAYRVFEIYVSIDENDKEDVELVVGLI